MESDIVGALGAKWVVVVDSGWLGWRRNRVCMSSSGTKAPICYFACHRRNLDDKRRLQIPAKWYRKTEEGKVEEMQLALILWPHDGQPDLCIQVLPPEVFESLWKKVTSVAFGDTEG